MGGGGSVVGGVSNDLWREFANAYPSLITYARAAAKLNPHLGDTNFMLNSIALGLKRGSPMILDNLGLVIKIGDANEAFAKSLGKSVAELTAEEKQMALLNATMDAGQRLVEQVGGNVESLTDSFTRLEAVTRNLADETKKKLAPSLATTAEAVIVLLTWSDRISDALAEQEEQVFDTADSYRDYVKRMTDALVIAGRMMPRHAATMLAMIDQGKSVENLADNYDLLTEEAFKYGRQTIDDRLRVEYHTGALARQPAAMEDHVVIVKSAAEEQWILNQQTKDDRLRTVDWTDAILEAEKALRKVEVATGDYFAELVAGKPGAWDMAAAMWDSASAADLDAQQMAILADTLGIYTDEQIAAGLEAAALKIKMDELSAAVAAGDMTMEEATAEFELMYAATGNVIGAYDDASQSAEELDAAIRELDVAAGDYFTTIIDEAEPGTWDLAAAMWESADAADWDAQQMAILAGALGLYTEEQVEAALAAAALKIKMDELAGKVADGTMTVNEAVGAFRRMRDSILEIPTDRTTTITTRYQTVGAPAPAPGPDVDITVPQMPQPYQKGAWNIPRNQLAFLHTGEMVIPAQAAQQIRETNTTHHHNYNLTTQSITRPGVLGMEFAAMEMASR